MGTIFNNLKELNICHAVCVGFLAIPAIEGYNIKDYFIVAPISKKAKKLGFYPPDKRDNCLIYPLSESEIAEFKALSPTYKLIISNKEGRVYELPDWSLKNNLDVQKEKIYTPGTVGYCEKGSLQVSAMQP